MTTPKLTENTMLCRGCNTIFRGLSNFDAHHRTEIGPVHKPRNGPNIICVPPALVGLVQRPNGAWGGPPMSDERKRKLRRLADDDA